MKLFQKIYMGIEMENIRISVVIPTFNSDKYIIRTLKTVFSQTSLPYEIVIVDDGSIDKTVEVIQNYLENYEPLFNNIKIIQQKNSGAGAARNNGIRNATGNWIAFLDSDDIWDDHKLEMVEEVIKKNPDITMIAHNEYMINEGTLNEKKLCLLHEHYNREGNLFLQLYQGNLFSTSCMTIRKNIIEKAGLFDETLYSAQDYDLWIRVSKYGKLYYMDKPLGTYVMRKGNITSNTYRRYKCEMKICRKYIDDLKEILSEEIVKKMVRKRIFSIHKVEGYLAARNGRIRDCINIAVCLLPELVRKV